MKFIFLVLLFFSINSFAVCISPISRTNVLTKPTSARYNGDLSLLFDQLNDLSGSCINDNSITENQFPDSSLTVDKFADSSVTNAKFAEGVIPSFGKPLRIKAYTSSGTWIKQADVGSILVQVVGGGGGTGSFNASAGTASSFGSHCIGNGGSAAINNAETSSSPGGSSSGGDVNLPGGAGDRPSLEPISRGGISMLGPYGRGGADIQANGGGGAGGFCMKVISKNALSDSVTVTIGNAGLNLSGNGVNGTKGLVIIYEYGR